jgi:phage gp36-like protein
MTYATEQDFIDRFGEQEIVELTNLYSPSARGINSDVLERNQASAYATINGIISNCPAVATLLPLASPYPPLLVQFELDLTRYNLDTLASRPDVKDRADQVMAQLRLIGKCEMGLGIDGAGAAVVAQDSASPSYRRYGTGAQYGGRSLRNYGVNHGPY